MSFVIFVFFVVIPTKTRHDFSFGFGRHAIELGQGRPHARKVRSVYEIAADSSLRLATRSPISVGETDPSAAVRTVLPAANLPSGTESRGIAG